MMVDFREKLAELEHEQWEHLARYWHIEHPLIGVPYSDLTEAQKDSDRKWADKTLTAFKAYIEECEWPMNPYNPCNQFNCLDCLSDAFIEGVVAFDKKLLESLVLDDAIAVRLKEKRG